MRISFQLQATSLNFLIGINAILFVLITLLAFALPGRVEGVFNSLLYLFGALRADWVLGGESWRIVTASFLHANWFHLLANMLAFYQLGRTIYGFYGGRQLFSFYLICGAGATILSMIFVPGVISVSASGAVFGLIGVLLAGSTKQTPYGLQLPFRPWDIMPLAIFAFLVGMTPGLNINNWAHLGGFITGLILGRVFHNSMTTWLPKFELRLRDGLYYFSIAVFVLSFTGMGISIVRVLTA